VADALLVHVGGKAGGDGDLELVRREGRLDVYLDVGMRRFKGRDRSHEPHVERVRGPAWDRDRHGRLRRRAHGAEQRQQQDAGRQSDGLPGSMQCHGGFLLWSWHWLRLWFWLWLWWLSWFRVQCETGGSDRGLRSIG